MPTCVLHGVLQQILLFWSTDAFTNYLSIPYISSGNAQQTITNLKWTVSLLEKGEVNIKELLLFVYRISSSETHTDTPVINHKMICKIKPNAFFDSQQKETAIFWEIWMLWIVALTCQWFYSQGWSSSSISEGCNGLQDVFYLAGMWESVSPSPIWED